jgi:DNA-binding NarL/FixJ family response regulator
VKQVPDIVILDISLPVMNGFEVAQKMRLIAPSTRIILLSIRDVPATPREIGVDAFVAKSSGIEALAATLEHVCLALPRTRPGDVRRFTPRVNHLGKTANKVGSKDTATPQPRVDVMCPNYVLLR